MKVKDLELNENEIRDMPLGKVALAVAQVEEQIAETQAEIDRITGPLNESIAELESLKEKLVHRFARLTGAPVTVSMPPAPLVKRDGGRIRNSFTDIQKQLRLIIDAAEKRERIEQRFFPEQLMKDVGEEVWFGRPKKEKERVSDALNWSGRLKKPEEMRKFGFDVYAATKDGSSGSKGNTAYAYKLEKIPGLEPVAKPSAAPKVRKKA